MKDLQIYILANRIMITSLAKNYVKNNKQLVKWMEDCEKQAEELLKKKSIDKKKR